MRLSRRLLMLFMAALLLMLSGSVLAQQPPADLSYATPVTGTLNAENRTDVYIFLGGANDTVTVVGTAEDAELGLLLTNSQGTTLAEAITEDGTAAITRIPLGQTGTYFVTVYALSGSGDYQLTLSEGAAPDVPAETTPETTPETTAETTPATESDTSPTDVPLQQATPTPTPVPATPAPVIEEATPQPTVDAQEVTVTDWQPSTEVLVSGGVEVVLNWDAPVDLNLEVRDPLGNSLFFNNRETPNGGAFGFDANGLCEVIAEAPAENASWSPGFLPTGSYEILVFYRQDCENIGEVDFTVDITVEGQSLEPINGLLPPPFGNQDSVYVANFILNEDLTASSNNGGFYPDSSLEQLPAPPAEVIAEATPIQRGQAVTGEIWEAQDYLVYSFEAQANSIISVDMRRTAGNLDTMLQLISPDGLFLEVNDDRATPSAQALGTDSFISGYRVVTAGTYYIVATRYGKDLGGTEGEFQLVLTEGGAQLPASVANLVLPDGDIEVYLTWATNADLQLLVRDPVGAAVFDDVLQVNSGGILAENGNVNCTQSEGNPVSYIYWPNGLGRPGIYEVDVWFQNTCQDTTPVEFTLTIVVNDEVIAVETQRPTIADRFVLSFSVNSDGTADAGRGGFISTGGNAGGTDFQAIDISAADPLPIQFNQQVNGSITLDNEFDVYSFQGTAGQTITASMRATSRTLDTKLFLVGPAGTVITLNDDATAGAFSGVEGRTTDSLISAFTLPETGEYRLVATRFGTVFGGTIGDYRLQVVQNE